MRDKTGRTDLTQILIIEIGKGVITGLEIGHRMVTTIRIFQDHLIDKTLTDDQWNSKIARSGHNSRETKTGQVWGSQLDLGGGKARNCTTE